MRPPPPPPHAQPPPAVKPPVGSGILPPHPSTPPPGPHGVILGVGTPAHHKPVYRVGETATGGQPSSTERATDVIQALQAFLAAHQGAVAAGGTEAPMPSTFTVTATTEAVPANAGGTGSPLTPVDFPPPHPGQTPPPLFKPGMVPPTVHPHQPHGVY
jgi:hypothetical protein